MKTFRVASVEEADAALEYFNYFHDGFIKRLTITSHDEFGEEKGQLCTGLFDIEIDFAHYNYRQGEPPDDQIVHAHFSNVMDILLDFHAVSFDWVISTFSIHAAERQVHFMPPYPGPQPCFMVTLARQQLDENRQWVRHEWPLFTFTEAIFSEA
jgi:hypothetical protein